jgi:hypothetical protein
MLLEGVPLHDAAKQLGISYDKGKRRRRQTIARLRQQLGEAGA